MSIGFPGKSEGQNSDWAQPDKRTWTELSPEVEELVLL